MSAWNSNHGAQCASIISRSRFEQPVIDVAYNLANRGASSQALTCLQNSGMDYRPLPPIPTEIVMTSIQFMDISCDVRRAEAILSRGNSIGAQRILQDVSRVLEEVNIQNNSSSRGSPVHDGRRN